MNLLIIEGPGKLQKIKSILGKEFDVIATSGHIEKLKDSDYDGTGISKKYDLDFEYIEGKYPIIKKIIDKSKESNNVYIATDPDREGEGIAWHIYNKLPTNIKSKTKRITFNEISEQAISKALNNFRALDINYINAYLTRVILDKKVGYGLSRYLQRKANLKSAGRTQSSALKLLVENNDLRNNFKSINWYKIVPKSNKYVFEHFQSLITTNEHDDFKFEDLTSCKGYIDENLHRKTFVVDSIETTLKKISPSKPLKTSDLLSNISKLFKINTEVAQKYLQTLYEKGYITYPRTDSTRYSKEFCEESIEYLSSNKEIDRKYISKEFKFNKNSQGDQDAHEAIRVAHLKFTPNMFNNEIYEEHLQTVYKLIYINTIRQFLKDQELKEYKIIIKNNNDYFSSTLKEEVFEGWNIFESKKIEFDPFPYNEGNVIEITNYDDMATKSTSKPPELFSQSSLISKLEKLGIGRPSTFASITETNLKRNYVNLNKKNKLEVNQDGIKAITFLEQNFPEFLNYNFTKSMEDNLDLIKDGKLEYKEYLDKFIPDFESKLYSLISLDNFGNSNDKKIIGQCPNCGKETFETISKNGKSFESCLDRKYDFKTKKTIGCDFIKWKN